MGRHASEKLRPAEYLWSVGRVGKAGDWEREDRAEGLEREGGSVCVCVHRGLVSYWSHLIILNHSLLPWEHLTRSPSLSLALTAPLCLPLTFRLPPFPRLLLYAPVSLPYPSCTTATPYLQGQGEMRLKTYTKSQQLTGVVLSWCICCCGVNSAVSKKPEFIQSTPGRRATRRLCEGNAGL